MRTLAQPTRANDMPTLQITQKQSTTATNLGISPRFSCFAAFVFARYVCVCALPFVLTDDAHTRVEYCIVRCNFIWSAHIGVFAQGVRSKHPTVPLLWSLLHISASLHRVRDETVQPNNLIRCPHMYGGSPHILASSHPCVEKS